MKFVANYDYKVVIDKSALIKFGNPVFIDRYLQYNYGYLVKPAEIYARKGMLCVAPKDVVLSDVNQFNMFYVVNFFEISKCKIYKKNVYLPSCTIQQRVFIFNEIWRTINYV